MLTKVVSPALKSFPALLVDVTVVRVVAAKAAISSAVRMDSFCGIAVAFCLVFD